MKRHLRFDVTDWDRRDSNHLSKQAGNQRNARKAAQIQAQLAHGSGRSTPTWNASTNCG